MFNSLAGLLVSLTSPILIRVLAKLGMGIISYAGFEYLLNKLQDMLKSHLNGMMADILAILGVGGFGQAMGIIVGAFITRLAFKQIARLGVLAS